MKKKIEYISRKKKHENELGVCSTAYSLLKKNEKSLCVLGIRRIKKNVFSRCHTARNSLTFIYVSTFHDEWFVVVLLPPRLPRFPSQIFVVVLVHPKSMWRACVNRRRSSIQLSIQLLWGRI